ncbi:MAG TPA: hypothetical protein VJ486_05545 [Geothrix sp.]|nr:hypothetical protein [Geothrix sp.]
MTWKPSPRVEVDPRSLPLDPGQGYLLSLVDGSLDVATLAALLNLENSQVRVLLEELVELGAVEPETTQEGAAPEARSEGEDEADSFEPEAASIEEEDPATVNARTATHRQLFEQHLHSHPVDMRVAMARIAEEPELSAWCFDPTSEVIRAVLENPRRGSVHGRLIAIHHRTATGLEALGAITAMANDPGLRRALLQNPILPPGIFRRLFASKRLLEQYLVAASRDVTEQVRAMARDLLRTCFNQRAGEERAELIITTEGRCLASITGLTIDGRTTALLCRRTYTSTLFIQNLARWGAAPPQLIAHLRRQDLVKRNPTLRMLLERHPNAS